MTSNKAFAALVEARRLLDGLRFTRDGAFVPGELVTLTIGVQKTGNPEVLEARLTAHGPGSLVVDWEEVAFFVEDRLDSIFLNRHGRATFKVSARLEEWRLVNSPSAGVLEDILRETADAAPADSDAVRRPVAPSL